MWQRPALLHSLEACYCLRCVNMLCTNEDTHLFISCHVLDQ